MRSQLLKIVCIIFLATEAFGDSQSSLWTKETLINNVTYWKAHSKALNQHTHQNVAHATVTKDGDIFAAAYPKINAGMTKPANYTFTSISKAESSEGSKSGYSGEFLDVINRHRDGKGVITRTRAYGVGGRNEGWGNYAAWNTPNSLYFYEKMHTDNENEHENLNLGLQTAVDGIKNGYIFFVKVADDIPWTEKLIVGLGAYSDWYKTRGLHFQQYKGIGDKKLEAGVSKGFYTGVQNWLSSYGWSNVRKNNIQLFSDLPRALSIEFAAGAKDTAITYCVAGIYDHASRTYPETTARGAAKSKAGRIISAIFSLGATEAFSHRENNQQWWRRYRQGMGVTAGIQKDLKAGDYYDAIGASRWIQLGSTESLNSSASKNKETPFLGWHRYTRVLCIPNSNYIAFAEHKPNFSNSSSVSTILHYKALSITAKESTSYLGGIFSSGSSIASSFSTDKRFTISGLGRGKNSNNGSPLDICYKPDDSDPTIFLAAVHGTANEIHIYGKNVKSSALSSACYLAGKVAFQTLPKQICIQPYQDYLVLAWQEGKKIKVGYVWIEKMLQLAGSTPGTKVFGITIGATSWAEHNRYIQVVPCCSHDIYESTSNITLRTFDIQASKMHITFLQENKASNPDGQTYLYLYTDVTNIIPNY